MHPSPDGAASLPARRPEADSKAGITISSVVPGITVLFTTATGYPLGARHARPRSAAAAFTYDVSIDPSSRDGVPTHRNANPALRTTELASPVTLIVSARRIFAHAAERPGS